MSKPTLHWLITADIVLSLILFRLEFSEWRYAGIDPLLVDWMKGQLEVEITQKDWVFLAIGSSLFALQIFAWVWLWKLKPYARELYAGAYALMIFLSAFGSAYVVSGWMLAIEALSTTVIGVIIGGLYLGGPQPQVSEPSTSGEAGL